MSNLRKSLCFIFALLAYGMTAWAQNTPGNLPAEVRAEDATITELGHATMTVEVKIVTDSLTRRTDTLFETKNIEWHTDPGTAQRRNAERNRSNGSDFYNGDSNWWLDVYWYRFNYPSINAEGEPVLLSALACMPDEDCDYINNVIIGCHVTITSNGECPSEYQSWDNWKGDASMLMNHAGSGLVFHSSQSDMPYYNLVILPDYEGYGITRSHAHPYLYQELTARQVVDGARYGIALYKSSPSIGLIRHPFRSGWRSICIGYSQGGSVAMATHRFIEQNGLTDELQFAGSVCGDGPYDPIATLMYYMKQYKDDPNDGWMSMPVVLPLILKGMCDSNPYMKNHQVSDYLSQHFLDTGILTWLTEKEKTTDDITKSWCDYYGALPNHGDWMIVAGLYRVLTLRVNYIMKSGGYDYFSNLYDTYQNTYTSTAGVPLPTQRGLMQDLQFALASNNLTKGWAPQHAMFLYHSYDDSVVPEDNRESAGNSFGEWVIKLHASGAGQFDHVGSGAQFFLGLAEFAAIRQLAKAPVHQTMQNAIAMKNDIFTGGHTLDPWDNPPVINSDIVIDSVTLNGKNIAAEFLIKNDYARLGSGNNACISQYSEGKVEVPATITVNNVVYPVQEVSAMAFRLCTKITEVVLPENVYYIGNFAFKGCRALTKLTLPSTLVTLGTGAFIDLPNLHTIDCRATTPPDWEYNDVFKFHTGGISDNGDYSYDIHLVVPEGCVSTYSNRLITKPDLGWNHPDGWGNFTSISEGPAMNAEAYVAYYPYEHSLTFYYDSHREDRAGMTTYGLDETYYGNPKWYEHRNDVTKVVFTSLFYYARPTSTAKWFCDFSNLTSIEGWEHLVTDEVTAMNHMFRNCAALTDEEFDLSHLNTASVTNMQNMFEGCVGLVQPDLSHFDTRSCTTMENMFYGCTQLTSIDLGSCETTACSFNHMFWGCTALESVNLGSFGVTDSYICQSMFYNCTKLSTIVIPSAFDKLQNVFRNCSSLTMVYCYKPAPFALWNGCDNDFASGGATFHVLASTLEAWMTAYGPYTETPANVTFVGDLGTEDNPFLLYGTADWVNLGQMAENGLTVNAKMMNGFTATTMVGSDEHPFTGTFDGNGHTLNMDMPNDANASRRAPFSRAGNATIKNLVVDGTIKGGIHSAGLVGAAVNGSTLTIENCRVKATVSARSNSTSGPHIGGFVGHGYGATISIKGCLFDGTLETPDNSSDTYAGVFVGWCTNKTGKSVVNCYANGTYSNYAHVGMNYDELASATSISMTNCYHNHAWGEAPHAYSLTTNTEGLTLDFGEPTAIYSVSGITAYDTGMKLDDVFYAGSGETVHLALSAQGYEYDMSNLSVSGGATYSVQNNEITLAAANAVISMPGMTFTTVILYDDANDNNVKLYQYMDQTYKVQLMGHTISKSDHWSPLCLPFDLPNLNGTPLEGASLKVLDAITFENKVAIFHFKDTTAIRADRNYLVHVPNDIESPVFNNVTIKRSLPPGMKNELDEFSRSGFGVMGNYNRINLRDVEDTDDPYIALYFDHGNLRVANISKELCAFQCFLEVLNVDLDTVVACAIVIESGNNFFKVINNAYADIDNIFVHDGDWNDYSNWAKDMIPNDSHKVLIEGQAIIPADCLAEADEITFDLGTITIADGGQLLHHNAGVEVTMQKNIEAYNPEHTGLGNTDGWYFIAIPFSESITPTTPGASMGNFTYDLYRLNNTTWENFKNTSEHPDFTTLDNGKGYLYACSKDTTLLFEGPLKVYSEEGTANQVNVNQGWNLIGNPFACNVYADRAYFKMNEAGTGITPIDSYWTNPIAPCTGIIVNVEAAGIVTFTKEAPAHSNHNNGGLQITLSQVSNERGVSTSSTTVDNAIVSFNEGSTLTKFRFGDNAEIYIPQNGEDYAIAFSEGQGEIPLNFKAKEDGEYNISVNPEGVEMAYLHLIDNITGADVDLLALPEYTFTAKTTDYESRFKLVFSSICEDANGDNEAFAFISNGNIIVNGEGTLQVIDMTGRVIVSRDGVHSVSTNGMMPGVYVLRLINGDDVKTQKMVIK